MKRLETFVKKADLKQLKELQETLSAEIKLRESKGDSIEKVMEMIKELGLDVSDLKAKKPRGAKPGKTVAIKYQDPKNPSNTWTGRGATPVWMKEQLAAGKSKENFLIKS